MADNKKREERRRKRRKGAAAGRPANYSQLYKNDNSISQAGSGDQVVDDAKSTEESGAASGGGGRKGSDSVDWQGEYRHVLSDLRNVLIISALIFALMIGVGLFL